jgi:hypothetical protein
MQLGHGGDEKYPTCAGNRNLVGQQVTEVSRISVILIAMCPSRGRNRASMACSMKMMMMLVLK